MAFSMIASKKAAPVAALIRKLAFNDARALQAASVQLSTRSFYTNAREVEDLDDESKLGCGSGRRIAWRRARDNDVPYPSHEPTRMGGFEIEHENRLEMQMDMPGLGKEHVKLSMKQNTLIIKGDGEEEIGEEEGARRYHKRIDFPDGFDCNYKLNLDEMEAEMKNGILKIVVPKVRVEERKESKDWLLINVK